MKKQTFNDNWQFWKAKHEDQKQTIDLPHDAMRFEKRVPNLKKGVDTGFYPGGLYYYEKQFQWEPMLDNESVFLEFAGVYQKSEVSLNGEVIGCNLYGYTDFILDLSDKLKKGENVLTVKVDNTQTPNSRWYSGSGIYRDVYLLTGQKPHILPQDVTVTTKAIDPAVIHIAVETNESTDYEFHTSVLAGDRLVGSASGQTVDIEIPDAYLWNTDDPYLYTVQTQLLKDGEVLDTNVVKTGIRTLNWDHTKGFEVNDQSTKLFGGCIHHDNGILGANTFKTAEKRRVKRLKEAGFNAIRYTHNPAPETFLDACDEVGIYVMVEAFDMWEERKSDYDYGLYFKTEWQKDIKAMIQVAKNHPSVIMYSIGNEIMDIGLSTGKYWTNRLANYARQLDGTRPVTLAFSPSLTPMAAQGLGLNESKVTIDDIVDPLEIETKSQNAGSELLNQLMTEAPENLAKLGDPAIFDSLAEPSMSAVDIVGINYSNGNYEYHSAKQPHDIVLGTENFIPQLAEHWEYIEQHSEVIGEFLWTAWDYLGEAGIGLPVYGESISERGLNQPYPSLTGNAGIFDLTGHEEAHGYFVQAVWHKLNKPYIGVRPLNHANEKVAFGIWRATDAIASWSWAGCEGVMADIEIYATGSAVELFQDGKSFGRQKLEKYHATFQTKYYPGSLSVKSFDEKGQVIGENELQSANSQTQLTVKPEEREISTVNKDIAFIDIALTDDRGIVKMLEDREIRVVVKGPGKLIGLGSADPAPEENDPYIGHQCLTCNGRAQAIIRSVGVPGPMTISVSADDLPTTTVVLDAINS